MNSLLTVERYRQLLHPTDPDREEDVLDLVQQCTDTPAPPANRFDALKAIIRRKRKRPTSLSPIELPSSSANYRPESTDEAEEQPPSPLWQQSPSRLRVAPLHQLPPLVVDVLERKKLFLDPSGNAVVGIEEILQLREQPSSPPKLQSPFQLIAVPRKVFEDDEVALMPCHTLHYRYIPSLEVERWREPVRDRDKNWRDDELSMILATHGSSRDPRLQNKMTRGPSGLRKGTWRRLDSQRLQIKTPAKPMTLSTPGTLSPRDASLPNEVLLRSQGAMISRTYCIVTIHGIGIYGRLYSDGLVDRPGNDRHLRIEAYDPATSTVMTLKVSMNDLAWVFESNPELLAAGKKQTVLKKVVTLLYIEYPDEDASGHDADGAAEAVFPPVAPTDDASPSPLDVEPVRCLPVLCISPTERMNEAALRRLEREERLRREEQDRLRLLALLMKLPRRARHRIVCKLQRISGHEFVVSIYHFPSQVRNFLVSAYHPRTSRTLTLAVGVQEAASMSRILTQPHKWTVEQKQQIAQSLLPMFHLRATRARAIAGHIVEEQDLLRVALAIRDDRMGAQASWLPLTVPHFGVSRKDVVIGKYKKDGQQELRLTMEKKLQEMGTATAAKVEKLRLDIQHAEATIVALIAKDAQLKEQIEDINSGKGIPVAAIADENHDKQHHHEMRRAHKAARKTIKDESKALQARVVAWKRELEMTKESDLMERDKLQTRYTKAVDALTQRATTATLEQWFDPHDRKQLPRQSERHGNRQHTVFHRAEIRDGEVCVVSGACRVASRRFRYSVFAEAGEGDLVEAPGWFQLAFYDAETSGKLTLRLTRLELISFAKQQHEALLQIPMLGIATSPVCQKIVELDAAYASNKVALAGLSAQKKHDKKRVQLTEQQRRNRQERGQIWRNGTPWQSVMKGLCEKLSIVKDSRELSVDRCIYRATLTLASIVTTSADDDVDIGNKPPLEDEDGVVDCEVTVTQHQAVCVFHARDLLTDETWSLEYPDSTDLVKEFAVEALIEQQLHLEAIAMTLLLYTDPVEGAGKRKMRFED